MGNRVWYKKAWSSLIVHFYCTRVWDMIDCRPYMDVDDMVDRTFTIYNCLR